MMEEKHVSEAAPEQKKELNVTPELVNVFAGRKNVTELIRELVAQVQHVDFRDYLKIDENKSVRQKHQIYGVVKKLSELADSRQLGLWQHNNSLYMYNGQYWMLLEKPKLKELLSELAIAMGVPHYEANITDYRDKLYKQFYEQSFSEITKTVNGEVKINLLNGTYEYNPDGGRLKHFDPLDQITYQLQFDYDPNATCPLFESYLHKVLPDESLRILLQEFSGYLFSDLNLEKILMLCGPGANGKSVYFNIIQEFFAPENRLNFSLGDFAKETNRAKLQNARINYSSEKGDDVNPDLLKALASREPLQARVLYNTPYNVHYPTRFLLNANEFPKITEQTDAFYRRFIPIPFDQKIPENERNPDLAKEIIEKELPGIFNWLLQGLKRLTVNKRFSHSDKVEAMINEYKRVSNSVLSFIEEKAYKPDTSHKVAVADLYNEYKAYCLNDGYRSVAKNTFSTRLKAMDFEPTRLSGGAAAFLMVMDYSENTF